MNDMEKRVLDLESFSHAIATLISCGAIEREHGKAITKAFLKEYGFDATRPVKKEEVTK